jgi:hypothetical protein
MSLMDHAKSANFGEEDTVVMLGILSTFFGQWDSGGAVWAVAPVLMKLIAGKPLTPLTGDDDEWVDVGEPHGNKPGEMLQNKRCSTVFRQGGRCYDIDVPGRPDITFPYEPKGHEVPPPVMTI